MARNYDQWHYHLKQAFLMASEGMSVRKIHHYLVSQGATHPNGKPLTVTTLWRHLNDPGYTQLGTKAVCSLKEPLISQYLFVKVARHLNIRRRRPLAIEATKY